MAAAARCLKKIGPGQGGPVVGDLGDLFRRVYLPDGKRKAMDHPEVVSTVLHLHSLGYRNYCLYGAWRWMTVEDHVPAIRAEMRRLESEIQRLTAEKPKGWKDLSGRYAAAIEGLAEVIDKAEPMGEPTLFEE